MRTATKTLLATIAAVALAPLGVAAASDIIVTDIDGSSPSGTVTSNEVKSPGVDRCPDEGAVSNSWEYVGTDPDTGQPVYAWICRYPDINHGPAESN
ncbi:hypothetical protein WKY82_20175 [Gordonia malaquae]|uniref:hypothetical protein n=1 Tax=Gordonia malaquae TaxID=410332 RepID=UPI0030C795C3